VLFRAAGIIRLVQVFRDYCGVLSEESIRKNFILIYELLDEIIVSFPARVGCRSRNSTCILCAGLWARSRHQH